MSQPRARSVLSVEKANRHACHDSRNLAATGLPAENYQLRLQDVFIAIGQLAETDQQFDLILADPRSARRISAGAQLPSRKTVG